MNNPAQFWYMNESSEPILDLEWRAITAKSEELMPNDDDVNNELLEIYQQEGVSPRGCAVSGNKWIAKIYIGGKQRILGYGSCYQCARLYDAAFWRFRQYRTKRELVGQIYNFGEAQAGDDNLNPDIQNIVCGFEDLLIKRGLLRTPEQREADQRARKAEYQSARYTTKGRLEHMLENLLERVEDLGEEVTKINTRLESIERSVGDLATRRFGLAPDGKFHEVNPAWITPGAPNIAAGKAVEQTCTPVNPVQ